MLGPALRRNCERSQEELLGCLAPVLQLLSDLLLLCGSHCTGLLGKSLSPALVVGLAQFLYFCCCFARSGLCKVFDVDSDRCNLLHAVQYSDKAATVQSLQNVPFVLVFQNRSLDRHILHKRLQRPNTPFRLTAPKSAVTEMQCLHLGERLPGGSGPRPGAGLCADTCAGEPGHVRAWTVACQQAEF